MAAIGGHKAKIKTKRLGKAANAASLKLLYLKLKVDLKRRVWENFYQSGDTPGNLLFKLLMVLGKIELSYDARVGLS